MSSDQARFLSPDEFLKAFSFQSFLNFGFVDLYNYEH